MEIDGLITAKYEYNVSFKFIVYRTDGKAIESVDIYCKEQTK